MIVDRRKIYLTGIAGVAWVAALVFGLRTLLAYETTPGAISAVPEKWPASSAVKLATDRPTLVVFAHPHCPCTRATVAELAQIIAQANGKLAVSVLFWKPANGGADWDDTPLRESVRAIPGVVSLTDVDGTEARRFGAETSGHTELFGTDGHLLFSGGITGSRGHAGPNEGENSIVALLKHEPTERTRSVVFGCSLAGHLKSAPEKICLN